MTNASGKGVAGAVFCGLVVFGGQVALGLDAGGEFEVQFMSAAEEKLAAGEGAAAAETYREAFVEASRFEERIALIGPLTRSHFVSQELGPLLTSTASGSESTKDWEHAVFEAAVYQFLQDLTAAGTELLAVDRQAVPGRYWRMLRQQMAAWVEEAGDFERIVPFAREVFSEEPTVENHALYLRALLESGSEQELKEHVAARKADLAAEAGLWRSFLPELSRRGQLATVAPSLETAWKEQADEAQVAFALAELRLFQGEKTGATELFWAIFEMEEKELPADALAYFQRLNHSFHNRFAVKNRLGQATGAYGTEMARQFMFLGLRENFDVSETGAARDAALLYLRELEVLREGSGRFLRRVRDRLDRKDRSSASGILAYAGVGAPAWMLDEVEAFVESADRDSATAGFSLLAMNRYVLSTNKFPELRERMGDLARAMHGKLEDGAPGSIENRARQMQAKILSRLGLEEANNKQAEEGSREDYHQRISEAAQEGNPAEAERLYREMVQDDSGGTGERQNALLFLAGAWRERDAEHAAELVAESLEPLYSGPRGGTFEAPLQWKTAASFPPRNPYLNEPSMEELSGAFQAVAGNAVWDALKKVLAEREEQLRAARRAPLTVIRMIFHSWADEPDQAVAAGRSGAEETGDPQLKLLLAYLLASQDRYEEGSEVLAEVAADAPDARDQALRLRFALAVAEGDGDEAKARADELTQVSLTEGEKLQVAFGLVSVGRTAEAGEWVDPLSPDAAESQDTKLFRRVSLSVLLERGEHDRAAGLARLALMGEVPENFSRGFQPLRREALEALDGLDRLDDYQDHLKSSLELAPHSLSLHLLLAESADFRWQESGTASAEEKEAARTEAVESYARAASLRPLSSDLQLELCEWLAERELWAEAVGEFQSLLRMDATSALLDSGALLETYRQAGELPLLVDFFEEWQAPEAESMDEFYGLQPTEHLLRPLGEALLEEGERAWAARAWEHGLHINPIGFTEEMRLSLAELYAEDGRRKKVFEVLEDYVGQENVDPHLYAVQPFASVTPRWIKLLTSESPHIAQRAEGLLELAENEGGEDLRAAAEAWQQEKPDRFSTAVFGVYVAARAGVSGWKDDLAQLEEAFAVGEGPFNEAWEAVQELFAGFH